MHYCLSVGQFSSKPNHVSSVQLRRSERAFIVRPLCTTRLARLAQLPATAVYV